MINDCPKLNNTLSVSISEFRRFQTIHIFKTFQSPITFVTKISVIVITRKKGSIYTCKSHILNVF